MPWSLSVMSGTLNGIKSVLVRPGGFRTCGDMSDLDLYFCESVK